MDKKLTAFFFSLLLSTAVQAQDEPLQFTSVRIPEAPPGAGAMAAYMTIVNDSDRAHVIENVSSPEFDRVDIHRSVIEDGVARMEAMESLHIPPNETLSLSPGGIHLMLLDPPRRYTDGEQLTLVFEEQDGTRHGLTVTVRRGGSSHGHSHSHD